MEKEIRPGVFISVISHEKFADRLITLTGEDLHHFILKCNKFKLSMKALAPVGIKPYELQMACEELDDEFDPEYDYFTVRNVPNKEGA
ncbi:MAG: hypothetical protein DRI97_17015 [Bacteroidetes bacterium]|nr:MAG: hypothetical protein DRI97_17015 [Bacteroidota bacterium]